MTRGAVDFLVQMHERAVVKHGDACGLRYLRTIRHGGGKSDVVALPFTGRTADIYERRCLAINCGALAVRRPLLVERVEDLNLVKSVNGHAVVPAVVPRSIVTGGHHPFDVKLKAPERLRRARRNISRCFET